MQDGTQTPTLQTPTPLLSALFYLAAAATSALETLEDRDLAGDLELDVRRTVLRDAIDVYRNAAPPRTVRLPIHYCSPQPR